MPHEKQKIENDTIELTVVVHGLFAFVVHPGFLDLVTPVLSDHAVAAGTLGSEMLLEGGERYVLSGPQNTPVRNMMIDNKHIVLSAADSTITAVDPGHERFCCVRMPVPKKIDVCRYLYLNDGHPPIFVGKAVNQNSLATEAIPTITALRFPVLASSAKNVWFGDIWQWNGSPDQHLEIWAEPPFITHNDHASKAFNTLVGMFSGLDLDVNPEVDRLEWNSEPADETSKERSQITGDLKTLQERCGVTRSMHSDPTRHAMLVHVRTCFSAIVMD